MTDPHQQIADLEAEIDTLSDAAEQCRKSMIVARVAAVVGFLMFGATLLGLTRSDPIVLVVSIAATLAGIGFYGSSRSSLENLNGKIRGLEARRTEIINGMELPTVQDRQRSAESHLNR
jgi:3-deoxy-D-arabino-heptulosonate 7-phosphate (DAHP) synthase class II